jgi:hypothetical protein
MPPEDGNPQLLATRDAQGRWSKTADALKKRYETVRRLCFALSIGAALLAALASQLPDKSVSGGGAARLMLSVASGCLLAIVAVLTGRFLTTQNSEAWIRARAASEALKRIAYMYAAQAAPYDQEDRDTRIAEERKKVIESLQDLKPVRIENTPGRTPINPLTTQEYLAKRVAGQKKYYEDAASKLAGSLKVLRSVELVLALVGAVITAAMGMVDKTMIAGVPFDFVAFTAVLTTLSGALLAYIEASRMDFLIRSFLAAAQALDELLVAPPIAAPIPNAGWSAFVGNVENVLATENGSWIAKMKTPTL